MAQSWLGTFTDAAADKSVGSALESAHMNRIAARVLLRQSSSDTMSASSDAMLDGPNSNNCNQGVPEAPGSNNSNKADGTSSKRLLLVVVDEARSLLEKQDGYGINYFRILCRALKKANTNLKSERSPGRVFAILIDTNSQIHDFMPPIEPDPSSRHQSKKSTSLFPPFVLTQTKDVMLLKSGSPPLDYKASVTGATTEQDKRNVLLSMGIRFGRATLTRRTAWSLSRRT